MFVCLFGFFLVFYYLFACWDRWLQGTHMCVPPPFPPSLYCAINLSSLNLHFLFLNPSLPLSQLLPLTKPRPGLPAAARAGRAAEASRALRRRRQDARRPRGARRPRKSLPLPSPGTRQRLATAMLRRRCHPVRCWAPCLPSPWGFIPPNTARGLPSSLGTSAAC